jgi:DNA-directed RNA polymerase subunit RPC12/RpoP
MNPNSPRGAVYRCEICGAEVTVLARQTDRFHPRCCNTDMVPKGSPVAFYLCPLCGAEIAVLKSGGREFLPRCCNRAMVLEAA